MKKGFTLIELLAVIVILAVIAVITTPFILNVVEKSKKGALQDSAYGLIEAAQLYRTDHLLDEHSNEIVFTFQDGKQTSSEKLSYLGKVENGSARVFPNGKVALCIQSGEYMAMKNKEDRKVSVSQGNCFYHEELGIYLNNTTGMYQGTFTIQENRNEILLPFQPRYAFVLVEQFPPIAYRSDTNMIYYRNNILTNSSSVYLSIDGSKMIFSDWLFNSNTDVGKTGIYILVQ